MDENPSHETLEELARFVREEAARLMGTGVTWKIVLNGDSGGNVRGVVETYADLISHSKKRLSTKSE